jgi:hypothetical protein
MHPKGHTLRTSQRSEIAATLLTITQGTQALAPTSSRHLHHQFPPLTAFSLPSAAVVPISEEEHPGDDPNPSHHNSARSEQNLDPEPTLPTPSLAHSLALLARHIANISTPKTTKSATKPRRPDTFDGSDPSTLDSFIFQCSMYIAACSGDFPDDEARVAFVLSYLHSAPLDWFQAELTHAVTCGGQLPKWFTAFPRFLAELRRLFGPHDPVNNAIEALESLMYEDSTRVAHYTLEFNCHSPRTGWNEPALARYYYRGLPDRLKDDIARLGKPAGLASLQDLANTLDQRYWERQSELGYYSGHSASSSDASLASDSPSPDPDFPPHPSAFLSASTSENSAENSPKNILDAPQHLPDDQKQSASIPAPSLVSILADLLGPDGKLKPEERQRRLVNGLCLRCGKPGHMVNNCLGTASVSFPAISNPTASDSDSESTSESDSSSEFETASESGDL